MRNHFHVILLIFNSENCKQKLTSDTLVSLRGKAELTPITVKRLTSNNATMSQTTERSP